MNCVKSVVKKAMDDGRLFPCQYEDEYEIKIFTDVESRKDELVDMLVYNFLHDETLVKSLRLNDTVKTEEEYKYLREDENLLMSTAVDSAAIILTALHKETNRIAGVLLITIQNADKKDGKLDDDAKSMKNTKDLLFKEGQLKSRVINDFFYYIEQMEKLETVKLTDKYPNCEIHAEYELIAVNKLDRKKGLALDLYKAGLTLVKEIPEIKILAAMYTSNYSKRIAEKIGKTVVTSVDVLQLKDKSGNPVFQDTKPHNIVSLMAMEL